MDIYVAIPSCVFIVASRSTKWTGCSTCSSNSDPNWTCPAAVNTYADLGGSDAAIAELDFGDGKLKLARAHKTLCHTRQTPITQMKVSAS